MYYVVVACNTLRCGDKVGLSRVAVFQAIYEALDSPDGISCHNCVRGIASRLVMPLECALFTVDLAGTL